MSNILKPLRKVIKGLHGKKENISPQAMNDKLSEPARFEQSVPISTNINENKTYIKELFADSPDVNIHTFHLLIKENQQEEALLVSINGIEDAESIHRYILEPLKNLSDVQQTFASPISDVRNRININDIEEETDLNRGIEAVLRNQAFLMVHGFQTGLLINVPGAENRSLEEAATEAVVRGSRVGFIESIYENMSLIRRRIRHPSLRYEFFELGTISKTKVALGYIEAIAQSEIIDKVRQRLSQIDVDSINSSGELEQFIEDHPYSIFPTISNTERPDRATAQMFEGRFVIIVDGDPVTLVGPYTFFESFQSAEDYSSRPYYASFVRFMRISAFLLSISLPAVFIAALNFHKEIIPSELIVSMTAAREVVPFPVPMETLIMIILFEIVREAGIRMPRPIGQAVSIVGALILGEVSVTAGLVGAPTIIVVAFSTISSFAITRIADVMAILRIALLIPASLFGAYGFLLSLLGLATHMLSLKSFGVPYMAPLAPVHFRDWGDTLIRFPLHWQRKRPQSIPNQRDRRIKRVPIDYKEDQH